jgi:3-hydroxyacyl-CoA dehydrogenase
MLDMASEGNDRSAFAHAALEKMIKTNPAPLYSKKFRSRIETGNFEDDLSRLSQCDWIIEVVKEDLNIKRALLKRSKRLEKPEH